MTIESIIENLLSSLQGSRVKLIINMMNGNIMAAVAEAFTLSNKLGLPSSELIQVIEQSAVGAPICVGKGNCCFGTRALSYIIARIKV